MPDLSPDSFIIAPAAPSIVPRAAAMSPSPSLPALPIFSSNVIEVPVAFLRFFHEIGFFERLIVSVPKYLEPIRGEAGGAISPASRQEMAETTPAQEKI
jgi:hypothetical protein